MRSRALVLGCGAVGGAVVRGLAAARVPTLFTFAGDERRAAELARETGARAERLDLADGAALPALLDRVDADLLFHCAAPPLDADLDRAYAVYARAAFVAATTLAPRMKRGGGGDLVFFGAIDRAQSLPLPAPLAAAHGMVAAMTMALAKQHGRDGVRVNMVALGLLDDGLSRGLDPAFADDYRKFSALRRLGAPSEAARVALWLALESTYVTGKVIAVNGGI